jgi:ATP-dependent Lon protease
MTSPKTRPTIVHGESRTYPVLPLRDIVVFPNIIVPLFVGREKSIRALEEVMKNDALIMLATQKNASDDDPTPDAIYETGTLASVLQLLKLPDGTVKVLVEASSVRASKNTPIARSITRRPRLRSLTPTQTPSRLKPWHVRSCPISKAM